MKRIEADVSDGKLKECSLCRSTNLRHDDYSKHILIGEYEADNAWFTVTCKDCGLHLHKKDFAQLAAAWNTRVPDPAALAVVEALEAYQNAVADFAEAYDNSVADFAEAYDNSEDHVDCDCCGCKLRASDNALDFAVAAWREAHPKGGVE